MKQVFYDYVEADGAINTLYPREDFAHSDTTSSTAPLTTEKSIDALAAWIETRRAAGLSGGIILKSKSDDRSGRYSIDRERVI